MSEIKIRPYNHKTDFHHVTTNLQLAGLYDDRRDIEPLLEKISQERSSGILVARGGLDKVAHECRENPWNPNYQ